MRIVNVADRLGLITTSGVLDVEKASNGRFSADPQAICERWAPFRRWADEATIAPPDGAILDFDPAQLGSPAPRPARCLRSA